MQYTGGRRGRDAKEIRMKHTGTNTSLSLADDEFAMGVEYEDSNSDSDFGIHVCCWRLTLPWRVLSSPEVESISR